MRGPGREPGFAHRYFCVGLVPTVLPRAFLILTLGMCPCCCPCFSGYFLCVFMVGPIKRAALKKPNKQTIVCVCNFLV